MTSCWIARITNLSRFIPRGHTCIPKGMYTRQAPGLTCGNCSFCQTYYVDYVLMNMSWLKTSKSKRLLLGSQYFCLWHLFITKEDKFMELSSRCLQKTVSIFWYENTEQIDCPCHPAMVSLLPLQVSWVPFISCSPSCPGVCFLQPVQPALNTRYGIIFPVVTHRRGVLVV